MLFIHLAFLSAIVGLFTAAYYEKRNPRKYQIVGMTFFIIMMVFLLLGMITMY